MGVTDPVAREDYGALDVFELAERVFPAVLDKNTGRLRIVHDPYDRGVAKREREEDALGAAGRGLLALAPLALLVLTMQGLRSQGWHTSAVLALSFGITAAMIFTCGPMFAIGRRTAIYLGFEYCSYARQFLAWSTAFTAAVCVAAAGASLGVLEAFGLFGQTERLLFSGTFAAWGILWLLAGGLSVTEPSVAAVSGIALGLLVGALVASRAGADAGLATGYAVALSVLALAWRRSSGGVSEGRLRLPAPGLLLLEAAPYVGFGSLFALLLIEPHVLGWEGRVEGSRMGALGTLELSFTLALPPVLIASGLGERTMRAFWTFARARREQDDPEAFCDAVSTFRRARFRRYAFALACLSAAVVAGVEVARRLGSLHGVSQLVFLCAVVGFLLFGLGQFNCLFMLGLGRSGPALASALGAVIAVSALGVPLASVDFRLAAVAFAGGATVLAATSSVLCARVVRAADFHYAAAF